MTVAQQVRRLSSFKKAMYHSGTSGAELERGLETAENELANELEQARAKLAEREKALTHAKHWIEYLAKKGAELEQQVARETPGSQTLKEHVEALTRGFNLKADLRLLLAPLHPTFAIDGVERVDDLDGLCRRLAEVLEGTGENG